MITYDTLVSTDKSIVQMSQSAIKLASVKRPPTNQENTLSRLLEIFDELPPQLQLAARYIIDNPREIGVQTMRSLASNIGVHPNTFTRLARALGFDGYESMRERFRDFVRAGSGSSIDRAKWLQAMAKEGGNTAVLGSMAQACLDNTEQMFRSQSINDMDKAADMMLRARKVHIVGVGLAYSLAYNFWYLARIAFDNFVLIPNQGTLLSDDLLHITKHDCLVAMTFQPYRNETLNAIKIANCQGAKTISITDSMASTAYRDAHVGLVSPTHTPQFFQSNASVNALIDSLTALLVAKGGEKATQAIERFNSSRWDANVYEEI